MVGTMEAEGCFKDMEKTHMKKHNRRSGQKEKLNRTHTSTVIS